MDVARAGFKFRTPLSNFLAHLGNLVFDTSDRRFLRIRRPHFRVNYV